MNKSYKFADEVWHRVVQIIQEAMLMGIDCVDLLRMIEVTHGEGNELVLTERYIQQVEQMHAKWLAEAERLQKEGDATKASDENQVLILNVGDQHSTESKPN